MKYQHTPDASKNNAFNWRTSEPSIFLQGKGFAVDATGLTKSQQMTMKVEQITKATGRSPGTISGMSPAGDKRLAQQKGW